MFALRGIQATLQYAQINAAHPENLFDAGWWERRLAGPATLTQMRAGALNYGVGLLTSLTYVPFVYFEANIRRLVYAVDSEAGDGGTAPFKNIYTWLLARLSGAGWTWPCDEAEAFLDIYRLIRNSLLHTGGVFLTPRGEDEVVTWNGTTYEFRHGEDVAWADDGDFVLQLISKLIDLTTTIMRADPVSDLPAIA